MQVYSKQTVKNRRMVISALMIAIVTVMTLYIKVPSPDAKGYLNMGDGFILLSGYFLGPVPGFLAGGLGSALADLISGYAYYAPFTLIIKGLEGFLIGYWAKRINKMNPMAVLGALVCSLWMIFGYYIALTIMVKSFVGGLASIPGNIFQGALGMIIFVMAGLALEKAGIRQKMEQKF